MMSWVPLARRRLNTLILIYTRMLHKASLYFNRAHLCSYVEIVDVFKRLLPERRYHVRCSQVQKDVGTE
jgi:hypothetical protein